MDGGISTCGIGWQRYDGDDGMTTEEKIDRLTGIVDTLAASVVAHDSQIEALIKVAEKQGRAIEDMSRQWQAYLNTLPRQ